uniref:Uncharacterized protein n=1 Tax=Timema douglasi TaxID=61478 RepID=A0A7R8ZCQ1_TIMDO|nr:unnamed protein product [Timema douglasi]
MVSDGVVAVDTAPPLFIQARQDVGHVVGEEPLVIEHCGQHLGHCGCRHAFLVLVEVHLEEKKHLEHASDSPHVAPQLLLWRPCLTCKRASRMRVRVSVSHQQPVAPSTVTSDSLNSLDCSRVDPLYTSAGLANPPADAPTCSLVALAHTLDTPVHTMYTPVHTLALGTLGLISRELRTEYTTAIAECLRVWNPPSLESKGQNKKDPDPSRRVSSYLPPRVPQSGKKSTAYLLDKEGDKENKESSQGKQREHAGSAVRQGGRQREQGEQSGRETERIRSAARVNNESTLVPLLDKEGDRENKERSQGKQREHAGPAVRQGGRQREQGAQPGRYHTILVFARVIEPYPYEYPDLLSVLQALHALL